MKKFFGGIADMLSGDDGISSKRVAGFLCVLFAICVGIYCTVSKTQAPDIVQPIFFGGIGLLGAESVTGAIGSIGKK